MVLTQQSGERQSWDGWVMSHTQECQTVQEVEESLEILCFPDPSEKTKAREIKNITEVTYLESDRARARCQVDFPVGIPDCKALKK